MTTHTLLSQFGSFCRYLELAQNALNDDASVELARLVYFKAPAPADALLHLDISFNPDLRLGSLLDAIRVNDSLTSIDIR